MESKGIENMRSNVVIKNPFGGRDLKLKEHQIGHFDNCDTIWSRNIALMDVSPMGSGKNMIIIGLAMKYTMGICPIAPKPAIPVWKKNCSRFQIPLYSGNIFGQPMAGRITMNLPDLSPTDISIFLNHVHTLAGLQATDIISLLYYHFKEIAKKADPKAIDIIIPTIETHIRFRQHMHQYISVPDNNVGSTGKIAMIYSNYYSAITGSLFIRLPIYPKKLRGTPTPEQIEQYNREMTAYNNFDVSNIILTYGKLRSVGQSQPKHGLLYRIDKASPIGDPLGTGFVPGYRLEALFQEGCIIAFDEMHHIKNKNAQFDACRSLTISCLKANNNRSRLSFISGTPCDSEHHIINVCRLLGFIRQPTLCVVTKNNVAYHGAADLINICRKFDNNTTNGLFNSAHIRTNKDVQKLCYDLFIQIIKPNIISRMPPPHIEAKLNIANGFYNMDLKSATGLHAKIQELADLVIYNDTSKECFINKLNKVTIKNKMQVIELLKVPILIRLAKEKLNESPNNKVIIYISFIETFSQLAAGLVEYQPMIINGQTSDDKARGSIIDKFQNSPSHRLLIVSLQSMSESGSFCDKYGNYPRFMFIVPSHEFLTLLQAIYRIYRIGTKSDATVRFIYSKQSLVELSLLNAIAKKKATLEDIIDYDQSLKTHPNEYED
jgi:hypothetical protein